MKKFKRLPIVLAFFLISPLLHSAAPTPTFTATPGGLYSVLGHFAFDDDVNFITATASTVYVAGYFSRVGVPSAYGLPINTATGFATAGFPDCDDTVRAAVPDGTGGWYIAGDFKRVAGQPRMHLAHIFANNSLDPVFLAGTDSGVYSLELGQGTLFVGGYFQNVTSTNGTAAVRNYLAAFDTATGNATAFDPNCNGSVHTILLSGGLLYAGGEFTTVNGGTSRGYAAAFITTTAVVNSYDPLCDSYVYAMAFNGPNIMVGGIFTTMGVTTRNYIGMTDATGALNAFDPNVDGTVWALTITGSTIYAGGEFFNVNGATQRMHLAAFDTAGAVLSSFQGGTNGDVNKLVVGGGALYVGGHFTTITDTAAAAFSRSSLAAFDSSTGAGTSFNPDCAAGTLYGVNIYGLCLNGTSLFVGGDFRVVGGARRNHVAAFDAATGALTAFDPDIDDDVSCLALGPGVVYAGGLFRHVKMNSSNLTRNFMAAFDLSGAATAFDPDPDYNVFAILAGPSTVYAGGNFGNVNGGANYRPYLASFDLAGVAKSTDFQVTGGPSTFVEALDLQGGTLYAGGLFSSIGGLARNNLAAVDAASGIAVTSFDPNLNDEVVAISVGSGKVYAGGKFTTVNGSAPRNYMAAFNCSDGQALPAFNPNCDDFVYAVVYDGGTVYAGGRFFYVNNFASARHELAAFDGSSGAVLAGFDPNPDDRVFCLALNGTSLYAGGAFGFIAGEAEEKYAALKVLPAPTKTTTPQVQIVGAGQVLAYPQPVKDKVCFAFYPSDSGDAMIELYDPAMRPVGRYKSAALGGMQNTACEDAGFLVPGVYIYRIKVGSYTSEFKKFWVAR